MSIFKYNSNHKIITAVAILVWAAFHFMSRNESELYYENGQNKLSGKTVNGKNHGVWTWYYENGKKEMQGSFNMGDREGAWITWDKAGNMVSEGYYKDNRLNGTLTKWNVKGEVISKKEFINDKPIGK